MNFNFAISVLLMFSAVCYLALGMRMVLAKREVGTMPIGVLFLVISIWVLGGAVELLTDVLAQWPDHPLASARLAAQRGLMAGILRDRMLANMRKTGVTRSEYRRVGLRNALSLWVD